MFLYEVADALTGAKVPFAVAGGYAVALHGAVRGTVDVDIVLSLKKKDFISAEAALRGLGLAPRLPVTAAEVFDFREEYIRERNLVAWSFVDGRDPTRIVDIVITHDLAKMRSARVSAGGRRLPVLSVPDLIAMKKASGRPQDLEDIRALKELHP
ncbi:MAG: hypothetical protein ACHQ51_04295 [Elusimicrobiota bacterium]